MSLAPCPYHLTTKPDCGHAGNCPLLIIEGHADCRALNPKQIVLVRSWVEGRTPE